ncbi:UDP-2,3-diacylglucosamine diphosphatase [Saccharicrinis aurantiacus]|uniref:UDP-2,3-diacylglucosamine diphosphatase n=1 Tax=Saccharicrinis aurantiacus TaxID=1849719 RepID=UPI0024908807|nr:UDP-2,3-diacylglucosamine diphosphatase [Saccharicrinis aurantiacus]
MTEVKEGKKIYFASDVHLGAPSIKDPKAHEKRFVEWLDSIKHDVEELYLLGDIFDFWHEYKHVAPRGFVRVLAKICELTDAGIPVHFFTGNHDIWVYDYLPSETGVIVHREPLVKTFGDKKFYLAHGDGLGPYDKTYNILKKMFVNPFCQWLFAQLHPNFAIGFAKRWSTHSRTQNEEAASFDFLGEDKEWLMLYANEILKKEHYDFFIFGHRHLALDQAFNQNSRFIYLGDWVKYFTYGEWDGKTFELKYYKQQ